ncbi:hypothetical protein MTO96_028136 [Rhipicephalus appendiculatus]
MNRRPLTPPPVFRGKGDEDLGDWLHLYERYGLALAWTDAEKADNLVFALEDLQQRQQQLGETPQEYVSGILQLCARMNPEMPESEKLRHLLRGLRPEMMERVAITNPVQDTSSRVDSVGMLNEPSTVLYAPTRQETPDKSTVAALSAMQETLRALTAAVDRLGQQDRRPFPRRTSRNTNGQ